MSEKAAAAGSPEEGVRHVTDAQEMRALAHPIRLALLEVLNIDGPLTATEASERIGESPATCSFHLRQLAKYGFVEEAGGGTGRRRPWRLSRRELAFSGEGDAEQSVAATELSRLLMERWLLRHEQWEAVANREPEWSPLTGVSEHTTFLTLEETAELQRELTALFRRYAGRSTDPASRPAGARALEAVILIHPFLDPGQKS